MRQFSSAPPSARMSRVRLFTAGHFHAFCGPAGTARVSMNTWLLAQPTG